MDKIYQKAKDVHVVATKVYGNGTDTYAYVDAACTTKFTAEELKEVFIKGALIEIAGEIFKPVSLDATGINFITIGDSSAVEVSTLAPGAEEEAE